MTSYIQSFLQIYQWGFDIARYTVIFSLYTVCYPVVFAMFHIEPFQGFILGKRVLPTTVILAYSFI